MPKSILFVHQNFPGQFRHIVPALEALGFTVRALGMMPAERLDPRFRETCTPHEVQFKHPRVSHPLLQDFEAKVLRAEATFYTASKMKGRGLHPDLIVGHPGWGEMLFLDQVWPGVPQLHYLEYYYREHGQDMHFDPEFENESDLARMRFRLKNASFHLSAESMDYGLAPTIWQHSTLPIDIQGRTRVIHDGIPTHEILPNRVGLELQATAIDGTAVRLKSGDSIVTFINRSLEPFRGYHSFMRALPELFRKNSNAYVVIVGGEGVSYGPSPQGASWKSRFLEEVRADIPLNRIMFTGMLPRQTLTRVLQLSRVHVYLSYPFVLSWSLLEAMSAGAQVVASDTAPVREVIEHGRTGWLVDFFDTSGLARTIDERLRRNTVDDDITRNARRLIVERYDLNSVCLPRQLQYLQEILP